MTTKLKRFSYSKMQEMKDLLTGISPPHNKLVLLFDDLRVKIRNHNTMHYLTNNQLTILKFAVDVVRKLECDEYI